MNQTSRLAILCLLAAHAVPAYGQENERQFAGRGKSLLTEQCGRCHQVAATGKSPLAEAPTFSEVMRRYKPDQLEEALAEGLSTGHPAMPEFTFEPDDVAAILAYLGTLRPAR
ncbi:MAG: cytochrome c [Bradyrhizobiaceae bacterium]|nr:cytochrome c [Bradyrhizobiaceae bacterium]